jgi:UDP-2,3-diacylglucosamine pyrophosphatase LpxH
MVLSEDAARARMGGGADVMIVGHAHEPSERGLELGARGGRRGRLIVLGDWGGGRGAHAVWDGSRLRLVT